MKGRLGSLLLVAARVALGVTFLYAAMTKIGNMELFAEETANYRMLPAALVPAAAVAIVGVEIVAGALLALGVAVRASSAVIGLLLVAFIVGLSQALLRGIDLRCGCFGGTEPATWGTVARDLIMLAVWYPVFRWGGRRVRAAVR
jgi:uncharacterized membrane protein YphA (DoxX/SURF4 family)